MSHFSRYQLPAVLWAGVIFGLSSIPGPNLPKIAIIGIDKIAHVSVYMILGLLIFRSFHRRSDTEIFQWKRVFLAVAMVMLYGISDELHQGYVPGRTLDVFDMLADVLGGLLAASALYLYYSRRRKARISGLQ